MKTTNKLVKVTLEFNVPALESISGETVTLTENKLKNILRSHGNEVIEQEITSKKGHVLNMDKEFEFMSFKSDCKGLIYDESNKETYNHFIHHYLKNYYVDSSKSSHYTNGGHWEHFKYESKSDFHVRMLSGKFDKDYGLDLGVKDLITIHLMSGGGVRMYGTGQYYRRVRELKTVSEQKEFWKWVFDSKMINPNDRVVMSPRIKQITNNKEASSHCHEYKDWFKHYQTYAQLIVNKCWRDGNLEVLKWIVDEYKLDLRKADKLHLVEAEVDFSASLLSSIISDIHDQRIHDTYNNDVLRRLYSYDRKKLSDKEINKRWENLSFNRFVEFIKYINSKFPSLRLSESTNYCHEKNHINKYKNIEDYLKTHLLSDILEGSDNGKIESANLLLNTIKKK